MNEYWYLELLLALVLFAFGIYVILKHKKVWHEYKKKYKDSKNPIINAMFRPNMIVYKIHVYFIAPFAIALSIVLLIKVITNL